MSHHKRQEHHIRPYKIAAQSFGLIACFFVLFFFAGKGIPEVIQGNVNEVVRFIPILILPIAGYIFTWYKELTGSIIIIAGGFILLAFFIINGDISTGIAYGVPFLIAGALFLLHISKRAQLRKHV